MCIIPLTPSLVDPSVYGEAQGRPPGQLGLFYLSRHQHVHKRHRHIESEINRGLYTKLHDLLLASLLPGISGSVAEGLLGGHELSDLVADHFLPDRQGHVLLPIVDLQMGPDESRDDGVASCMRLDALTGGIRLDGI